MHLGTIDKSAALWILQSAQKELSQPLEFTFSSGRRVPAKEMFAMWQALDELDDGTLGARMARHPSSEIFSQRTLMFLAAQERSGQGALGVLARYWALLSSQSEINIVRESNLVSVKLIHAIVGFGPVASQLTLLVLKRSLRALLNADGDFTCLELRMPLQKKAKRELEKIVGAAVLDARPCDALVYRDTLLKRRVKTKAVGVPPMALEMMSQLKLEKKPSFAESVAKEVQNHLPQAPEIEDIANHMGLEVRTFQRRLKEERTSFREVCLATRMQIAKACLLAGGSVKEVAFLCGYQNPISFSNAFTKKVGVSPGRYKDSIA